MTMLLPGSRGRALDVARGLLCCVFVVACYTGPAADGDRDAGAGRETAADDTDDDLTSAPDAGMDDPALPLLDCDAGDDCDAPTRAQHSACALDTPIDQPPPPWPTVDDRGEPTINAWLEVDCGDTEPLLDCDEGFECPFFAFCLHPIADAPGVCVSTQSRENDDCQGAVPLSFRGGACVECVSPEDKAAACCAKLPGFDCRAAPFEGTSVPGAVCLDAKDCELGLVCAGPSFANYGHCVCPGVDPAELVRSEDCGPYSAPGLWGVPTVSSNSDCYAAQSPGFVVDVLARGVVLKAVAALGPDGTLHVFYQDELTTYHLTVLDGTVSVESTAITGEASGLAAVIDSQGHAHLALAEPLRYATNASGTWISSTLGPEAPRAVAIALDPAEVPRIVYFGPYDDDPGSVRMTWPEGNVWTELVVAESSVDTYGGLTLWISPAGRELILFSSLEAMITRIARDDGLATFTLTAISEGLFVQSVPAPAGGVLAVWDGYFDSADKLFEAFVDFEGIPSVDVVWMNDNPRYKSSMTYPFPAFDTTGKRFIAHQQTQGTVLRERLSATDAVSPMVSDDVPVATFVIDEADEPHLIVPVRITYDERELRYIHRGSCPTAP